MAEEWKVTHYTENGEELFLSSCGKYYTRHAWEHFGEAYRGNVRAARPHWLAEAKAIMDPRAAELLPATVGFMADPDGNTWDLSDVHWGMDDEDTEELYPLPAKP